MQGKKRRRPDNQRFTAPAASIIRYILTALPPETLYCLSRKWTAQGLADDRAAPLGFNRLLWPKPGEISCRS